MSETRAYSTLTNEELSAVIAEQKTKLAELKAKGLKLDLTRGKPSKAQLALTEDMLTILGKGADCTAEDGTDCRNYGVLDGIPEAKQMFSDLLDIPAKNIIVFGNSSLNIMFDTVARAMLFGVYGSEKPWSQQGKIKFLCPAPGYDRHFGVTKTLGIEMITIKMTPTGPDMDEVEKLVASDASIKGMWCVPKYSNPDGYTYSDETVDRLAKMKTAAPDFRIFWDNAYAVHDLYDNGGDKLANIFDVCAKYGTEDRVFCFASTSKISFPGAGVAIFAASDNNIKQIKPIVAAQTIGHDKLNQLRHVKYFRNADGIREQMKKHAAILRPKFECVDETFNEYLGGLGIAHWTKPNGGYFVSLYVNEGCAKKVYDVCKDTGVTLTTVGATYPYGKDPYDSNLRISPSFPPVEELRTALVILCECVKLVCAEKELENRA